MKPSCICAAMSSCTNNIFFYVPRTKTLLAYKVPVVCGKKMATNYFVAHPNNCYIKNDTPVFCYTLLLKNRRGIDNSIRFILHGKTLMTNTREH